MAAKKKPAKKSTTKRPSVSRAKPQPKACCGRLRGHAPDCQGETAEGPGANLEPIEAAAPAVAEEDSEAPVQPGPYLAALQSIAASLLAIASRLPAPGETIAAAPPAAQEAPRKPRKPKEAPEATPAAPEPQAAPPAPLKVPLHPCCGLPAAGPHREGCPALVKAKLDALEKAPAAEPVKPPTVDQVRSAFLSYASANGRDAAVALLGRFGAAKVAEIPAEQFPALLGAIKAGV